MDAQNSDTFMYLFLILAIYFLVRVWFSVKKTPISPTLMIFKRILLAVGGILVLSGFFYWRLRNLYSQESGLNNWFIALDITLAHIVVTLPVFYLCIFLAWDLIRLIREIVAFIAVIINPINPDVENFSRGCVMISLPSLIIFLAYKYLLTQSLDIQLLLFGAFDPSLGFQYPTTYRFSVLYAHLQSVYETLRTDQIMISILGLLVIITGLIIGISNIIKAFGDINKEFENRSKDKKNY